MAYHVLFSKMLDPAEVRRAATAGLAPRHATLDLAEALRATTHFPRDDIATWRDRLAAKMWGSCPGHWATARALAQRVGPSDLIYAMSEDCGLPSAVLCGRLPNRPKIVMVVHNAARRRTHAALRFLRATHAVDLFLASSQWQVDYLRREFGVPPDRVRWLAEVTDTHFFTPQPSSEPANRSDSSIPSSDSAGTVSSSPLPARRPLIVSVGLEKRDYRTLAAATADLKVSVQVSGYSPYARAMTEAFPDVLPANMERRVYSWPELVALYRAADVVVVSLFDCPYAAGLTAALEATACRRPVIITQIDGLTFAGAMDKYLVRVPPRDPAALRQAITRLIADPLRAAHMAAQAHAVVCKEHSPARWQETILTHLARIHPHTPASRPAPSSPSVLCVTTPGNPVQGAL